MAFSGAQGVDARYSTFTEIHGDQVNITNINYCMRQSSIPGVHPTYALVPEDGQRPHATSARFDSTDRQPCLEGTRKKILESVHHWISSNGQSYNLTGARVFR
jgi:hypothetical protein